MILVDDRVGSKHYAAMISNAVITRLEYGDVAFEGNGVTVGIEIKKVLDAVDCMFSGRLADHQVPGLRANYDVVYLLIEGVYRPCPESGVLQHLKLFDKESEKGVQCGKWVDASRGTKRLMYSAFAAWITSLSMKAGLLMINTCSSESTAILLASLYAWWQKSEHRSFQVMDETTEESALSRPTMNRRMMALLPRVGWSRSAILAERFKSMADAVAAPPEAWLIEGGIGMETARKIVEALNGTLLDPDR